MVRLIVYTCIACVFHLSCSFNPICIVFIPNQRSVKEVEPYFVSLALDNQDILGSDEKLNTVLALVNDEPLRKELEERLKDKQAPTDSRVGNLWSITNAVHEFRTIASSRC